MNYIIKNLEAIRKDKGLRQEDVAVAIGVNQQTLSRHVMSDDMKLSRLLDICKVLGVDLLDVATYPVKYVPEPEVEPECIECRKKDEIINNLNEYIRILKKK